MNTENNYEKTPVEGFGKAILSRMGWFEGRGIGKESLGEQPLYLNFIGREDRNGLGSEKQVIKERKSEIEIGSLVTIKSGKHLGVTGTVLEVREESAIVQIKQNKNHLNIPLVSLQLGSKKPQVVSKRQLKELRWVIPGLRVRVRNKHIYEGSIYSCKGVIEDVLNSHVFTIRISNKVYEDLTEKDIETLLPSVGSNVRIVKKQYKGEVSKLLARDKRKNLVTVQLPEQVISLSQNDVCDFIHE